MVALKTIKVAIATMMLFLTVAVVNVRVEAASQIMLRLDPVGYVLAGDREEAIFGRQQSMLTYQRALKMR